MEKKPENKTRSSEFLRTDRGTTKSNAIEMPSITLPKGGGAIKGIDEKFSVNAANGTSSLSVPLPISPGRNKFQPSLSLHYNSGTGNGPFGMGWDIDFPSIVRKTDKKLPQYFDEDGSDVFMFSGSEDLVPFLKNVGGNWQEDIKTVGTYSIKRYRPRVEGSFARIERISRAGQRAFYWRVTTKENVVTIFGRSTTHRIADPNDNSHVFQWLPEISFDNRGQCMTFVYKQENLDDVKNTLHEQNRLNGLSKITNQYLKRVRYANQKPYYPDSSQVDNIYSPPTPADGFLFEVVFDYGEHAGNTAVEDVGARWAARTDPFSSYRSGFEIRTYRLCQRVLMFHHFDEMTRDYGSRTCLVKSLDLGYKHQADNSDQQFEVTYLSSVTQVGYIRDKNSGTYQRESLPPVEFQYNELRWNKTLQTISKEDIVNAPVGLSTGYQWVDFYGEGIPGILTEQGDAWYYKRNLGDGTFTSANLIAPKPSVVGLQSGVLQLHDLEASGERQLVVKDGSLKGYFELSDDNQWEPFRAFDQSPNIDFRDPNTRLFDINGDGQPDIVVSEENAFMIYSSNGKHGYDSYSLAPKPYDEEKGPAIVFADSTQTIFLADMTGDGLTDIVRIRNSEICYWPNCGFGKFGAKIAMTNAPLFDNPDLFNPAHLHLSDVSGTGATDLLYLGKNKFRAWLNLSGNGWSKPCEIDPFFSVERPNDVAVVDLLGNATSCIVWSSPLPAHSGEPMKYIDLMGGIKPHIMKGYKNNLGKETSFEHRSSTQYYLEDKKAGTPWVTKLAFPVQCVSKVIIKDRISKTRYANEYKYHHGYYDHAEREFRGFGMVEQIDTDTFNNNGLDEFPVLTKTWFHTGAFRDKDKILTQFEHEYFYNQPAVKDHFNALGISISEKLIVEPSLPADLTTDEWREALRSCKGTPLRVEVYALDNTDRTPYPYSSVQHSCSIKRLQPKGDNRHGVFLTYEYETLAYDYERIPEDPRISHTLNLEVDELGNLIHSASIGYGRKKVDASLIKDDQDIQARTYVTYTHNVFTDLLPETNESYLLPLPCETSTFEITGGLSEADGFFDGANLYKALVTNQEFTIIPYETDGTGSKEARLIEQVRTLFLDNDAITPLPLRKFSYVGLHFEAYQLAFTKSLVEKVYGPTRTDLPLLADKTKGGYINSSSYKLKGFFPGADTENNFWRPSGTQQYDKTNFYQPINITDPFGNTTDLQYDAYHLFINEVRSPSINGVQLVSATDAFNYRVLSPYLLRDPNDNRTAVRFDALGMLTRSFVMGKKNENRGDLFDELSAEISSNDKPSATLEYSFDKWEQQSKAFPLNFDPDVDDYKPQPSVVKTTQREEHHFDNLNPKVQTFYTYSDGSGHELMKKVQAQPGEAATRDAAGNLIHQPTGELVFASVNPRWIGTGRTILNNKGKPVKQYESFFSASSEFEDESEMVETGVTPVIHYDPVGRVVRTDFPEGTFSRVEFDGWKQISYDQVDTVIASTWYASISPPLPTQKEPTDKIKRSAWLASIIADTPSTIYLDSLARPFLSDEFNRTFKIDNITHQPVGLKDEHYLTRAELDIEGNLRKVTDAMGNPVMSYQYDIVGHRVYQKSMDAGERWVLNDVADKPLRNWDSRDHEFDYEYDALHRPTKSLVKTVGGKGLCFEKISYGIAIADKLNNLLGKTVMHFDSAGVVTINAHDFKGNLLSSSRELVDGYKADVDWDQVPSPVLTNERFTSATTYDALNRPVKIFSPATNKIPANEITHQFGEDGLLNSVKIKLRGSVNETIYVSSIEYDAKGQRKNIKYGNNIVTSYTYDKQTYRLTNLVTRGAGDYQNLSYTYDPVGNITSIEDSAQSTFYFQGAVVEPKGDYRYDASYRLIFASGREHKGQSLPTSPSDSTRIGIPLPGDGLAMRNYSQQYVYDEVSNMLQMIHRVDQDTSANWTRTMTYRNTNIDKTKNNNHLLTAETGPPVVPFTYTYDAHGNMRVMPHFKSVPDSMQWNFQDELQHVDLEGGGEAWYVYDASGQRIRKVREKQGGLIEERIYLDGFELYRERNTLKVVQTELETLHVMDDKRRIALVETKTIDGSNFVQNLQPLSRYQHDNHLGTACLELTNENNPRVISYEEYHPYGTTAYQTVSSTIKATAKRYRYTALERDEETGFGYHSARYYVSWLGRWANVDPLGTKDGLNLFCYTKCNPISSIDTDGMETKSGPAPDQDSFLPKRIPYQLGSDLPVDSSRLPGKPELRPHLRYKLKGYADSLTKDGSTINPVESIIDRAVDIYSAQLRASDRKTEEALSSLGFSGLARAALDRQFGSWFGESDRLARHYSKGEQLVAEFRTILKRHARIAGPDPGDQLFAVISKANQYIDPLGSWSAGTANAIVNGLVIRGTLIQGLRFRGSPPSPFIKATLADLDASVENITAGQFHLVPIAATEAGHELSDFVSVSRWGKLGFSANDWVMKGPQSRLNHLLSFKWQPKSWPGKNEPAAFSSGRTYLVPRSSVKWPTGRGLDGRVKGLFGQRLYRPNY